MTNDTIPNLTQSHSFRRGNLVDIDGELAVVVGTPEDGNAPEDHLAVWFGDPRGKRISVGGCGNLRPEVWTIPADYFVAAADPVVCH